MVTGTIDSEGSHKPSKRKYFQVRANVCLHRFHLRSRSCKSIDLNLKSTTYLSLLELRIDLLYVQVPVKTIVL